MWRATQVTLKWEIVWTGGLPHLRGLPYLPGVPHLHVNRSLFKFIFLYLLYSAPFLCFLHNLLYTNFFIYVYHHAEYYFSYPRWCGWPGKARNLIFIINFSSQKPPLIYNYFLTFIVLIQWNFQWNISANLLQFTKKASSYVVIV